MLIAFIIDYIVLHDQRVNLFVISLGKNAEDIRENGTWFLTTTREDLNASLHIGNQLLCIIVALFESQCVQTISSEAERGVGALNRFVG